MRFRDEKRHPGPRSHAIGPVGGFAGLVFTVASLLIFVVGVPAMRGFMIASLVGGLVVFAILRATRK
jgi:hypothetical protein